MTRPLYLDCSPFMAEQLAIVCPDHTERLDLFMGDPSAAQIPDLARGRKVLMNGHTFMDADLLAKLPEVERIIFLGTGATSYIDVPAANARGVTVDIIPGYGDRAVAEHAFALMLAAARQVTAMDADIRAGCWLTRDGIELGGRRLGIVGLGGIGREFARMAMAFGMDVAVWNRRPLTDCPWPQLPLDEVLATSDVVSLHLALNEATRGFFNADRIGQMRPGAILVNTARAGLVDEGALIDALRRGHLGHAALDVFEQEPLSADSPWPGIAHTTLTAHAGFKTPEASQRLMQQALRMTGLL